MQKKVENILKIQCPFSVTFKEERKRQEIIQVKPNRILRNSQCAKINIIGQKKRFMYLNQK